MQKVRLELARSFRFYLNQQIVGHRSPPEPRSAYRQFDSKSRAFPRITVVTHAASMSRDNLAHDRHADTRAERLGRKERLEDIDPSWNTRASV